MKSPVSSMNCDISLKEESVATGSRVVTGSSGCHSPNTSSPSSAATLQTVPKLPLGPVVSSASSEKTDLVEEKGGRRVSTVSDSVGLGKVLQKSSSSPGLACSSSSPGKAWAAQTESGSSKSALMRFKQMARSVSLGNTIVKFWQTEATGKTRSSKVAAEPCRETSPISKRHSSPSTLMVQCNKEKNPLRLKIDKHVCFSPGEVEVFQDYTPYTKKYGAHPNDFEFTADGKMELIESRPEETALLDVKSGDTLECMVTDGVRYRSKPQPSKYSTGQVALGDEVVVKRRSGSWVQDSIGWLPLLQVDGRQCGEASFTVLQSQGNRFVTCRVPLMTVSNE